MMDLRTYKSKDARLADWLPWAALVAPGIVLNKDGAFQRTLEFRGPDLDSSTLSELMGASQRLDNALRRLGSGWCVHFEARRGPSGAYPDSVWPDALSWLIDEERRQAFETAGARFESRYFLTLTFLPPSENAGKIEAAFFDPEGMTAINYRAVLERFCAETETIKDLLDLVFVEARFLDDQETLSFLHGAISERPHGVKRPETPFHLDELLADSALLGGAAPMLGAKHLRTISVRAYVAETEPGLLDCLDRLSISYRWVTRYLPLGQEEARREFEKLRKRWFSKRKGLLTLVREALFREDAVLLDNDAANQAADSDAALQELQGGGCGAGYVTLTITLMDADKDKLDAAVRAVQQAADGLGFVSAVETINAVEAWLGSLPGQPYADLRRPILMTPNLAHLLPLSAIWAGQDRNAHLQGPPLLVAATDGATPFRLNLHHGDVGHTLVAGPTGSGKSVLLGLLAAQWRRYDKARVVILDSGRSCRALVLGLSGVFLDLLNDEKQSGLCLQPLARVDNDSERAFARDWLIDIFERAGITINPAARDEIWRALGILAARTPQERTLSLMSGLLQDSNLRQALEPYTHAGPYGVLLDSDADPMLDSDVLGIEMGALMAAPLALGAFLPALVRTLESGFDGRPTLLILDEAWSYLRDRAFAAQVQAWLKTLRKKNVAVVFATQELADVEASFIAATILEACPTRIFLANERAREKRTWDFYAALGLNPRQIQLIAGASPKRDYYVQTASGARRVDLELAPVALAFLGASRPEDHQRIDQVLSESNSGFAAAWLRIRGNDAAARAIEHFEQKAGSSHATTFRSDADISLPPAFIAAE
ncbi:MAG: conjugal transfer protein TrbE [Caulobacterales bacterium]